MLPGGSHQRRPKQHDAGAAPAEKPDEPASKYARMQWFLITWLVCDNALLTIGSLGKKSTRHAAFHLEMLIFPISMALLTSHLRCRGGRCCGGKPAATKAHRRCRFIFHGTVCTRWPCQLFSVGAVATEEKNSSGRGRHASDLDVRGLPLHRTYRMGRPAEASVEGQR